MTSSPPCDRSYLSSSGALRVIHVFRSCHKSPVGIFFSPLVYKYVLCGKRGATGRLLAKGDVLFELMCGCA